MKIPTIRLLPSGNYFCQLRINGQSISITEPTYDQTYAKAVAYKSGLLKLKKEPAKLTLRQAVDEYINARSNALSPSTIRGYRTFQRNRFQTVMDKPIANISNWQKICNAEASLCSAKTLRNAWGFVCSVLSENGVDVPAVRLPAVVKKERPWLTPEQITVFVDAIHGNICEIPALLALHSLRRSEICALTWDNVDLEKKLIHVQGAAVFDENQKLVYKQTNKNQTSNRVVPILIPALAAALSAVEDKDGLIVRVVPDTIWKNINRVCAASGLPEVGVHGLRHSFASLAYHLGLPERECMRLGGWADTATMHKIYTHISDYDVARSANAMADFYSSIASNKNNAC